jgi:hypothetical protein
MMTFFEGKFFHDKRRNLTVYEKLTVVFIDTELWWHLLNRNPSIKREGTWSMTKVSLLMLFSHNGDDIYWRGIFHEKRRNLTVEESHAYILFARRRKSIYWRGSSIEEKELDRLRNYQGRFYWQGVVNAFIEEELFHDKRRNLTLY